MHKSGFSLVELSIVLVILGLLTGAVLTGQSLIRASELRAVPVELQTFQSAIFSFKDKYQAIPGDMVNATEFWGAANTAGTGGQCANPDTNQGTGTQTCNGNGGGDIEDSTNSASANEAIRFWQHLSNAGLIEGTYTGIKADGNNFSYKGGVNAPLSKMDNGVWWTRYFISTGSGGPWQYANHYGNMLALGKHRDNSLPVNSLFIPEEAWNIDKKIDDGFPGTGKVLVRSDSGWNNAAGTIETCTTSVNATDYQGQYALTVNSEQCTFQFEHMY